MLKKPIVLLATLVPLIACLPTHAQLQSVRVAMLDLDLDPLKIRATRFDDSLLLPFEGNAFYAPDLPIIHGPGYLPMWAVENAVREHEHVPPRIDGYHFH